MNNEIPCFELAQNPSRLSFEIAHGNTIDRVTYPYFSLRKSLLHKYGRQNTNIILNFDDAEFIIEGEGLDEVYDALSQEKISVFRVGAHSKSEARIHKIYKKTLEIKNV